VLELTYNHDGRTYELGTGYGHIAVGVDDLDATLERLAGQGIDPERPPYTVREGGSRLCFVRDPDGNSIEAVHKENVRTDGGCIDHVWLRVRDVAASKQFYETIATGLGFRLRTQAPTYAHFRADLGSLTVTPPDESWSARRPLTENIHLAFPAPDRATVDEFHRMALGAGYRDNGPPGERRYHAGYYGAYVLDPDSNNVEAVVHR
jgi:catechol 2,3-dioxygenase-like lactoylglutathione lyase family enzyme